jgi:hypothetical protein
MSHLSVLYVTRYSVTRYGRGGKLHAQSLRASLVKALLQRELRVRPMRCMTAPLFCAEQAEQCTVEDERKLKTKGNAEYQEKRKVSWPGQFPEKRSEDAQ